MPKEAAAALEAGRKRLAEGRADAATDIFARALAAAPGHVGLTGALAAMHNLAGRYGEAEAACRTALERAGGNGGILTELGNALYGQNRRAEALEAFRRAVAADAGLIAAQAGRARTAFALGRVPEAEAACRAVLTTRPNDGPTRLMLGKCLHRLGRLDEALAELARLPDTDATHAEAAYVSGCALQHLGRLKDAAAALEAALAADPGNPRYHRILTGLKHFAPGDPELAAMEALAARPEEQTQSGRIELCFALAKAYEDLGRYDEAFAQLVRGNAGQRARIRYDEPRQLALLSDIAAAFPAERFSALGEATEETPVFIVGMPRSGTTLVEQILASHPDVHGAGETRRFGDCVRAEVGECWLNATADDADRIGCRYAAALQKSAPTARRIVDKMPGNFLYAGLIRLSLPGARILHVRRDPRDTCLSCFATLFAAGHHYAYDLEELARYYRAYDRLMAHWRAVLPPERFLEIPYEALVADFPREARRLVAFCGLSWDDACLHFHHTQRPVTTASAVQVRQPLYRHAVGRWRAFAAHLKALERLP